MLQPSSQSKFCNPACHRSNAILPAVTLLTAQGVALIQYHSSWIACATPFMSQVLAMGVLFNPGELEVAAEFSTKLCDAASKAGFVVWLDSYVI